MLSSQKALKKLTEQNRQGLFEPTDEQMTRQKALILMIYRDVSAVCRKHGLTLLLGGGSALGAVRCGGMIPWDDDIDLMLPRADYETLKTVFDRELGEKYRMQAPNAPGHEISNLYMKIILRGTKRLEIQKIGAPGEHGLWVDVFPIEYEPENPFVRAVKGFFTDALAYLAVSNYLYRFSNPEVRAYMAGSRAARRNDRLRRALGFLTSWADYRTLYNLFDRVSRGKRRTGVVTVPTGIRHYAGETHPARDYFPPAKARFEGEAALVPGDPRAYLEKLYGADYMTPPPPEKRERHFYVSLDFGPFAEKPRP